MVDEEKKSPWETETGLADDIDGFVAAAKFGYKEEYAQKVIETSGAQGGLMLILDLADVNGEPVASQGWSVGSGWEPSEDGSSISHPKRTNVVTSSMYGALQNEVVKILGVNMEQYGLPTEAKSWMNLGFHWMQRVHKTVGGTDATGLMPTSFLGVKGEEAPTEEAPAVAKVPVAKPTTKAGVKPAAKAVSVAEEKAIEEVKKAATMANFMRAIAKVPEIVADDAVFAKCLDPGPSGFYTTHKGK